MKSMWKVLGCAVVVGWVLMGWQTTAAAAPFAYVTNTFTSNVSVIDTATNTVVATITIENLPQCSPSFSVGCEPAGVAITPDGAFAYVANQGGFTVSVIDTATHTVVKTIEVGGAPWGVAIKGSGQNDVKMHAKTESIGV
jgi:YVTN family beta-propeller protein